MAKNLARGVCAHNGNLALWSRRTTSAGVVGWVRREAP